ncbi:MAG TPA: DUF4350 domain-containing protein [Vicinamibacterales bacterium]|nr:DUF4350 domain-containing protein [Vicinamibacterales bacterium]
MQKVANVLGWLGTLAVAASLILRFQTVRPEWTAHARWAAYAGLALIVLYMAAHAREIAASFRRRQTRLGAIAATSVVLVLGILVALNYLAYRRNHRWDLTSNQQFSLSDQTRQVLQKLDAPVKAYIFYDREEGPGVFRDRFDEYEYVSNGRLTAEYIDPVREPMRARQMDVQALNTVVLTYKDRTERVVTHDADEQQITNALIKVLTGEQRKIYFVQGHGERDTNSSERDGYSAIAQALGSENYRVEPLALAQTSSVPEDAAVVVIAGPTTDLLETEVKAIQQYLDRGGKLLVLIDPPQKAGEQPPANLTKLLRDWAIDVQTNVIVDTSGVGQLFGANEVVPVALRYPPHAIVQRFNVITAYPLARSIRPVEGGVDGRTAQTFIESSGASWGETNLADLFAGRPVRFDEGQDVKGPVSIGAAMSTAAPNPPKRENEKPNEGSAEVSKLDTRVVAIGDSDFASNAYLGVQGNRDLFINTVNWLAQQENLIAIRPRDPEDRRLTLTGAQRTLVMWGPLLALPVAVVVIGVSVLRRRRQ